MAIVRTDDVARRYGDTVALGGVSLSVQAGETYCLVGPNGAGKTTLVRAITGTIDCAGVVELFGDAPRRANAERIGLLPQQFSPPDRLTVAELLSYFGGLFDHQRPIAELVAEVGLEDCLDTYYENLSGGQQRRACVATALVNDPDLLVLDEPTTGIDPAGRRNLWNVLEGLSDAGTTILITTHYMAEAQRLGDRVGLIDDGQLVESDTPSSLIDRYGGASLLVIEGTFPPSITDEIPVHATVSDGELRLQDVQPETIGEITGILDDLDIAYESLTWRQPDLEDVYLALTDEEVHQDETRRLEVGG